MADEKSAPRTDDLQFDRAVMPTTALACTACKKPIAGTYFKLADKTFCASCKTVVEGTLSARKPDFSRALLLGGGAALLGAAVYWGVMYFLNLEIGIVAAFIGIGVGQAVRKGSMNMGGRKFQILAVTLTWFAIGLAYVATAVTDPQSGLQMGFAGLLMLTFAAPVFAVFSGTSGIISALIIGFGLRRAWIANTPLKLDFRGPFQAGDATPASPAPNA